MKSLIEIVNNDMSEAAESEASFVGRPSFRAEMVKQLEETDQRRHELEVRIYEMEQEAQTNAEVVEEKDKTIKKLQKQIKAIESGLQTGEKNMAANLDGMADLEAKLVFMASEKSELIESIDQLRKEKDTEIAGLQDKLNDLENKYKEARQAEVAVKMYEKKFDEVGQIGTKVKELEEENEKLKD